MDYFSKFAPSSAMIDFLGQFDLKIWEIGYSERPKQWAERKFQSDPYFRLYYIQEGEGALRTKDGVFRIMAGKSYLIPSGFWYSYDVDAGLPKHYWVHFYSEALGKLNYFSGVSELGTPAIMPAMKRMVQLAQKEHESNSKSLLMNLECRKIVGHFICAMTEADFHTKLVIPDHFMRVIKYIDDHYTEGVKTEKLAQLAELDKNAFTKQFLHFFGGTPKHYLCNYRITRSQILLIRTALPTKAIAQAVGYNDEYFFYRLFRRYVGMTPSEYRQSNRC